MKKNPIQSYGMIVFTETESTTKVALYARRNSYDYVEFLKGDWRDYKQAGILIEGMTDFERDLLKKDYSFDKLWADLWVCNQKNFADWKAKGIARFALIKPQLHSLLSKPYPPREHVWGFPKGRKDSGETPEETAKREFKEETGIDSYRFKVLPEPFFVKETYVGSDSKLYSTHYIIAISDKEYEPSRTLFKSSFRGYSVSNEAQEVKWVTLEEAYLLLDEKKTEALRTSFSYYLKFKNA
jgi:8-oxo-dGTP pyrophosphatase MutT (NUDIX family)